jgi:hypothetical protein
MFPTLVRRFSILFPLLRKIYYKDPHQKCDKCRDCADLPRDCAEIPIECADKKQKTAWKYKRLPQTEKMNEESAFHQRKND